MRPRLFSAAWMMAAGFAAMGQAPAPAIAPSPPPGTPKDVPTAEGLERWLEGKESVDIGFTGAGPAADVIKISESLEAVKRAPKGFRVAAGGGDGKRAGFLVAMLVTPESTKALLALQRELAPKGYLLDGAKARVWTYAGSAESRKKAREAIPEVLKTIAAGIKKSFPDAECAIRPAHGDELGAVNFQFPKSGARGNIDIQDLTTVPYDSDRSRHAGAFQVLHVSHLGIIVSQICWNDAHGPGVPMVPEEQAGVDKVFRQAMEPLIKLDPESSVWTRAQ